MQDRAWSIRNLEYGIEESDQKMGIKDGDKR
jgi:hypothetical protein